MHVESFVLGPLENNAYILWENGPSCVIIDAPEGIEEIDSFLTKHNLRPEACLLTHGHFDHITGLAHLRKQWNLRVLIHAEDADALIRPELNGSAFFGEPLPPDRGAAGRFTDGEVLDVAGCKIRVIHTPGHTAGGCCFLADSILFSGDTLFRRSVGRTDFPGASHKKIVQSIQEKLFSLPDATQVLSGHGARSTIGEEKQQNPFVGLAAGRS